jgi:hypothetical protein
MITLTPLLFMQQIIVEVHLVVLDGPQTIEFPDPLQQYGEPELQTLLAMGFWGEQFEAVGLERRGTHGLRASSSRFGEVLLVVMPEGTAAASAVIRNEAATKLTIEQ